MPRISHNGCFVQECTIVLHETYDTTCEYNPSHVASIFILVYQYTRYPRM